MDTPVFTHYKMFIKGRLRTKKNKKHTSTYFQLVVNILLFFIFKAVWTCSTILIFLQMANALPLVSHSKHKLYIDSTLTSVFEFHQNNFSFDRPAQPVEYADLQNRFNFDIIYNHYRAGGRLDTFNFWDISNPAPCYKDFNCKAQYIPEKLYFKMRAKQFNFVAGDFYLTIGRGIALAIRKIDEFGQDTTLRGGRISIEDETFSATIAGGFVNTLNLDPVSEVFFKDPNDIIFTVIMNQRFLELLNFGTHYVYADLSTTQEGNAFVVDFHTAGASLAVTRLADKIDLYVEGNGQFRRFGEPTDPGYALYANVNGYFFPFTLQLEGQWYHQFNLRPDLEQYQSKTTAIPLVYTNPPTLERQDLDTIGDNTDSKGLRLRVDYTLSPKTFLHANYLYRFGFVDFFSDIESITVHHAFIGGEFHIGENDRGHLIASTGLREMGGLKIWRLYHADVDLSLRVSSRHSIEVQGRYWWNRRIEDYNPENAIIFHNLDTQLSYTFSKVLSAAFLFSYSDDSEQAKQRPLFFAGELKVFLWEKGYLKLYYGRSRGGLRCISGVCRIFPSFEGFRTELSFRM